MKFLEKNALPATLLFCFVSTNFHTSFHFHSYDKKVESHIPDGREYEQHNISEKCDECLNKIDKQNYLNSIKIMHLTFISKCYYHIRKKTKLTFPLNLHSRPPPVATA